MEYEPEMSKGGSGSKAAEEVVKDILCPSFLKFDLGNKENIKPGGQDGVYEPLAKAGAEKKVKMPVFGPVMLDKQPKPGYKPFNHALLGDIQQPTASSSDTIIRAVHTDTADAPPDLSALEESFSPSVYKDDDSADDSAGSSTSNPSTVKRPNAQSPEESGDFITDKRDASSNMQACLQDMNPFRKARRGSTMLDKVDSEASDNAFESLYRAGSFSATPKSKFAAALSMRDNMPKPRAEVDPEDYGQVSYTEHIYS